jgi:hypothetical protein
MMRSTADHHLAKTPAVNALPGLSDTDKPVEPCQTWDVVLRDDAPLVERIARELADCRVRGLDRLDIKSRNQDPVAADELQRLATEYAEARSVRARGRIAQIKLLLRDALTELRKTNETDAVLISDLFFGDDRVPARKYATDLLKRAQENYGEPSDDRFREIRSVAFHNFAQFLIEFVDAADQLMVNAPSQSPAERPTLREQPSGSPHPEGRRFVHQSLVAVLRFSAVDPGDTRKPTIDEHKRAIGEYGRCWWGWFRALQDADHYSEIERRLRNYCEVGLWERSENLFYIAQCDDARADGGRLIKSPDRALTPEYYREQPYPAWFSFTSIRDSNKQEFEERFGHLPNTEDTIYWNPEPAPEPLVIQAQGNAILHLSDLGFGESHRWSTASAPHRIFTSTEQAITQTLLLNGIDLAAVGAVVICGNFASDQPSTEAFNDALAFIDGLSEQLPGLTRDHFVIVPGADDFARPGNRERSGQQLYRDFHESLYGSGDQNLSRIRRYEFATFRLNVLPVDSVKILGIEERDEGLFGYGYDSLLNVMRDDYLRNHRNTVVINAVAAHHHIMSTPVKLPTTAPQKSAQARVMPGMHDARDVISKLSTSRVTLYLHGHLHEADVYTIASDGDWRTVVCGAGTAGASDAWLRSRYRDNHGNSLTVIDVADKLVQGRTFVYDEDFRHTSAPFKTFEIKVQ